jgi:hypothetical protein
MKRVLVGIFVCGLLITAVAFSDQKFQLFDFQVQQEERNPWTHLRLNNDPNEFHFAVVSDRTGGHRDQVFSRAVEQLNLLQPEFVISVGDLIEGYTKDQAKLTAEWKEFQGYVAKLQMPFFYVPGNHDLANGKQEELWKEKFGRRYYHFVYRDVLFLMLNSDDPHSKDGTISEAQQIYARKTLEENRNVRWTIVALHRPIWVSPTVEKSGWLEVEKALAGRPYTVFAGHLHRYHKYVRQGQSYYQLATTGGGSKMRGVRYGEFDHIVWVTMKKDGPVLANVLLDGVYPEDMQKPPSDEQAVVIANRKTAHPVHGKVYCDGTPSANAQIVFHHFDAAKKTYARTGDAFVDPDGSFVLSSYVANDGAPVGDYIVTVVQRQPWVDATGKLGPNQLPDRYSKPETSDLKVRVKEGDNNLTLELKK